jgi:hypothetical protein
VVDKVNASAPPDIGRWDMPLAVSAYTGQNFDPRSYHRRIGRCVWIPFHFVFSPCLNFILENLSFYSHRIFASFENFLSNTRMPLKK